MIREIEAIISRHGEKKSNVVAILQDIQEKFRYLPREGLEYVSRRLGIPLSQIYSLATFYRAFTLKPRGEHVIQVCTGTACHVRGGGRIVDKLKRELNIEVGETTPDGKFTLETVNCLGACALGPLVVIDGEYYGQMNTSKMDKVLKRFQK